MARNIVPRVNKGADLGTAEKNWNRLFADAVILRGSDLKTLLDGKVNLDTLTAKGDLYVATDAGVITRLPRGMDGYVLKANSAVSEGLMWGPAGARQELTGDLTVTVGTNGDFPTINAALESIISLYYPKYISGGNCPRVTINLLSGFVMLEQVLVESLDLSWITITGADSQTIINRNSLTIPFGVGIPAFAAINGGFLPIIGQLFEMDTSGTTVDKVGILANNNSRAIILSGCGIKNTSIYNIFASDGSIINANNVIATGAGQINIYAQNLSMINASYAIAHGATVYGICAENSSIIHASGADASSAGVFGFWVGLGSIISAHNSTGTLNITANTITANGIIFK